jgi:large subunit ribosomal protein L25
MTIAVKAEKRDKSVGLDKLRAKGFLPAVYYGKKEVNTPIQILASDFNKAWRQAGESSVITISTGEKNVDALIHDVQFNPVTGQPIHADFYVFEKGQKIEVSVPLEFIGTSPAVKELGAVLVKVMHEIKIEAEPANLPHVIEVDISSLAQMNDHISAKEISLPKGVTLMENPDEMIVNVVEPKEEPVEETPVDLSAIEVEKKGKKDEEGAPSEDAPAAETK